MRLPVGVLEDLLDRQVEAAPPALKRGGAYAIQAMGGGGAGSLEFEQP